MSIEERITKSKEFIEERLGFLEDRMVIENQIAIMEHLNGPTIGSLDYLIDLIDQILRPFDECRHLNAIDVDKIEQSARELRKELTRRKEHDRR